MNIVLFGADGQLGQELQRSLAPLGNLTALGRGQVDLADASGIRKALSRANPTIVVNAAAYTQVDLAESNSKYAFALNEFAVAEMAAATSCSGAWLIHYSTDYIFDGKKKLPYVEDDVAEPLNVYGWSKLRGEHQVTSKNQRSLIFRTSWVYSFMPRNFVHAILKRARTTGELDVISDVVGVPTDAALIADITALVIYKYLADAESDEALKKAGVYNLVPSGQTTWFEYAVKVLELAELYGLQSSMKSCNVRPISSAHFEAAAVRPANSCLNNRKIQETFRLSLPNWSYRLELFIKRLAEGAVYVA